MVPPRPGTYRYRSESEGSLVFGTSSTDFKEEREFTTRYERAAAPSGEARLREVVQDEVDDEVDFSGYTEYSWRKEGQLLLTDVSVVRRSEDGKPPEDERRECNWEPDLPLLRLPLRPGAEWSWKSSCSNSRDDDGARSEETRSKEGSSKVTGTRQVAVAGQPMVGWVIETREIETSVYRFSFPGAGGPEPRETRSRSETVTTRVVVPHLGLSARSETDHKHEAEGFSEEGDSSSQGRSVSELLTPDPSN